MDRDADCTLCGQANPCSQSCLFLGEQTSDSFRIDGADVVYFLPSGGLVSRNGAISGAQHWSLEVAGWTFDSGSQLSQLSFGKRVDAVGLM